jgi:hypothetical protein
VDGVRAQQTLGYSSEVISGRWETYYTDRDAAVWTYKFDTGGRFRERLDLARDELSIGYDADFNPTSFADGVSVVLTATCGPVANLESVTLPSSPVEDSNQPVETTPVWDQPDPNRPSFFRLAHVMDTADYSTEYVYEDADDPTLVTTLIEDAPLQDPVSVDGLLNPLPTTGLPTGRSFWQHPSNLDSFGPIQRVPEGIEAGRARALGGIQSQSPGPNDWRYRFHWVVFPFGAHVGIDYNVDGDRGYLDYGQPPDTTGCSRCVSFLGVYLERVNHRYPREDSAFSRALLSRNEKSGKRTSWFSGSECLAD